MTEHIGIYRVERPIGRGGMGEVVLAWDDRLERRVAIKRVRQDAGLSPEQRERFRREARLAARLSHSAVVQIYDLVNAPWSSASSASGRPSARLSSTSSTTSRKSSASSREAIPPSRTAGSRSAIWYSTSSRPHATRIQAPSAILEQPASALPRGPVKAGRRRSFPPPQRSSPPGPLSHPHFHPPGRGETVARQRPRARQRRRAGDRPGG